MAKIKIYKRSLQLKKQKRMVLLSENEQAFKDFIAEQKAQALTVEWVNWMLNMLSTARQNKAKINPAWLRAQRGLEDNEPLMVYD